MFINPNRTELLAQLFARADPAGLRVCVCEGRTGRLAWLDGPDAGRVRWGSHWLPADSWTLACVEGDRDWVRLTQVPEPEDGEPC